MIAKKTCLSLLIGLMLNLAFPHAAVFAETKEEKHAAKVKAAIVKLGIGIESRVKVKLFDKTEIKGYVSEITANDFTVVNEKDNAVKNIPYPLVKQVKGNNVSTGAKVAILFGVIFVIAILFVLRNP